MRAQEVSGAMYICLNATKKRGKSSKSDNCEGCIYYGTEEYRHLTCRRKLHEEAAQLLRDMAGDIERLGGCTMCMHYDGCERDTKGTDVVLCSAFAYPDGGYKKYELERRAKNGADAGKSGGDVSEVR